MLFLYVIYWIGLSVWILSLRFVLVIFHWACCQYCWFCVFAVLVISVRLGILCTTTWKEYWKCIRIFLWTYLLLTIFLLCTSLLYEFYFVLLTESVCVCLLSNWVLCLYSWPLCFVFKLCIWYWKVQTWYLLLCWLRLYINLCNWVAKGYLFCLCLCHEGLFYFVTFLSQNFLFLFSGGEFVAVRSFWAFWKMGCLGFCRNSVLSKSWTILFCHKSIFWDWQFFSEFWLWLLFILQLNSESVVWFCHIF